MHYTSPPLPAYLARSLWQRQPLSYTAVMLLLHYLPRRLPEDPQFSRDFWRYCGQPPRSLEDFIQQHQTRFARLPAAGQNNRNERQKE